MSHRRFADEEGRRWEIREEAGGAWRFRPVSGNPEPDRRGRPPLYATDPFELSERELRAILREAEPRAPGGRSGRSGSGRGTKMGSPFLDDDDETGPRTSGSPFLDDDDESGRAKPRSPFLDDG